jgi:diguanylate cyclase (GGDEF)-like protein
MISLKKYLDMDESRPAVAEPVADELLAATMECYSDALSAFATSVVQICPALSADLETNLQGLGRRVSVNPSSDSVKRTEKQVEVQLREWTARASGHFKAKADEVKELLLALAKTAESVGNRDQGYSSQFKELTGRLEKIADLEDLTQIRSSLVKRVTELKQSVDQMTRDSQQLVAQLRAEVSIYETRLKSVEHLVLKDALTGVANRRSVEERIRINIESEQQFCVVMLDLNRFKQVNDRYGHLAGDSLLKQFATELQLTTRSGDLIGRWGGDEFVVVLACNLSGATSHVGRIRDWAFGKYTIDTGTGKDALEIKMDASIGVAEWEPGDSMQQVIEEADAAMYLDKKRSNRKTA